MQPLQLIALLAMVIYAIFRQTRVSEAGGPGRYKLALIYAGIGLATLPFSGWSLPEGVGWLFLIGGVVLSAVVGVLRGYLTRVWIGDGGKRLRQGTWLTVSLFVAVILVKVAGGIYAGFAGIDDGSSFSEILVIVAIMIAVQAEIVYRRARALPVPERHLATV